MPIEFAAAIMVSVAIIIAYMELRHTKSPPTVEEIVRAYRRARPIAVEISEVALTAARASEQLYRTGKIEKDDRLDTAVKYVSRWYPSVDTNTIITAIESAVLLVNKLSSRSLDDAQDGGVSTVPPVLRPHDP